MDGLNMDPMATMWWDDLADSEIIARLTNRGVTLDTARQLARGRERWAERLAIVQVLGSDR